MRCKLVNHARCDKQRHRVVSYWTPATLMALMHLAGAPTLAAEQHPAWEYKVVILQGITAGGTIERDASGVYVDIKRTQALNKLAADGWEVVSVTGSLATDHTVYLRRPRRR